MNERDRHIATPLPGPDVHVHDWGALALDYVDGTLGPEASSAVEQHLASCEECRSVLAQQSAAAQALTAASLAPPPAELHAAVFAALDLSLAAARPARRNWWTRLEPRLLRPRVLLPAAAAILLLAVTLNGLPLARWAADESATTTFPAEMTVDAGQAAGATATTAAGNAMGFLSSTATTSYAAPSAPSTTVSLGTTRGTTSSVTQTASDAWEPSASLLTPYLVEARAPADGHPAALLVSSSLGVSPVTSSLWLGGPTFAVLVPRIELSALFARLERTGLTLNAFAQGSARPGSPAALLAHAWRSYPVLVALNVGDPLGPVFIPQTLGPTPGDTPPAGLALVVVTASDQVR